MPEPRRVLIDGDWGVQGGSRYSTPKRARRSRCSTTMVPTPGSPGSPEQLCAVAAQAGADLGDDLRRSRSVGCRLHREPGHLAVQIGTLIARGHPGVECHAAPNSRRLLDQDRPRRQLVGRHRRHAGVEPAPRALAAHAVRLCPPSQLHGRNHLRTPCPSCSRGTGSRETVNGWQPCNKSPNL